MIRRVVLRVGGIALVLLLLISAGALTWLLATVGGRDFLLRHITAQLPAGSTLTWTQAEGHLAGPLTLRGVQLRMPMQRDGDCVATAQAACAMGTLKLDAGTLTLEAALLPLLTRSVRVHSLRLADARLDLPRDDSPFKLPRWPDVLPMLDVPVHVHVDAIVMDRLAIAEEGVPQILLQRVRGGVRLDPGALHIEQLRIDSDRGQFSAQGDYRPRDNFRSDVRASAIFPAATGQTAAQLRVYASGDLAALVVTVDGHAPAPVHAMLRLQGDTATPRWRLQANSTALDLAVLAGRGETSTPLAVQLTATGVGGRANVQGQLQQDDFNLRMLPSQLSLEAQTLRAHSLVAEVFDGRISADGKADLRDPKHAALALNIAARGLRWRSRDAQTTISADGDFKLEGTLARWLATGKAQLQRGRDHAVLELDGLGNRDGVQLRNLRISMPQGRLDASGQLAWSPALQWTAKAQLAGFDPGYFAPDWPGAVNGDLQSHGELRTGARGLLAQLEVTRLGGSLRKRALAGQLDVQIDGDHYAGNAELTLGQSKLSAYGKWADSIELDARFDPLQLQDLLPDGRGSVRGSVHLRGARDAPDITAELVGNGLAFADYRVAQLSAKGHLPWRRGAGALVIDAQGLHVGLPLHTLHADLRGAMERLQWGIDVSSDSGSLSARGDAGKHGTRWQGGVTALQLQPSIGPAWALQHAAQWTWDGRSATLANACLQAVGGGGVCADADWPRRGVQLAGHALPLTLLTPYLPDRSDGQPWAVHGVLSLNAHLQPVGGTWRGTATLRSDAGGLRNRPRARRDVFSYRALAVQAAFDPHRVEATLSSGLNGSGQLDAHIVTGFDAYAPLSGNLKLDTDALTWVELFSPDIVSPTGNLHVDVQLAGTRAKPLLGGQARLQKFSTELPALGISLHEGDVQLLAQADGSARIHGQVGAGTGVLQLDGQLDWRSDDTPLQLQLRGNNLLLADTHQLRAIASPDLSLRYRAGQPLQIRGSVNVSEANIQLERLDMGVSPSPDVVVLDPADPTPVAAATALDMDLNLVMGQAVQLDGYGLKGTLGGSLRVRATPQRDMLGSGALDIAGRYRAYGQNLQITRGRLRWSNTPVDDPLLDIRAERQVGDVTAGIRVEGRASAPQASVYSDPAKSESEALAYLTLGRPLSALSGNEARQLGAAKAALNAGSGLLAAELGARIGLDDAGVNESRALGGDVLSVGKYLSPKLYVGYGVSLLGTGQVMTLKYLLRKGFDIQIESSTIENRASLNWRKEK